MWIYMLPLLTHFFHRLINYCNIFHSSRIQLNIYTGAKHLLALQTSRFWCSLRTGNILFPNVLERWYFSKKYMKMWYFLQMFWKDGLSKNIAMEYGLSCCIIRKDYISFSRKDELILCTESERRSFSKNTWKYNVFYKYPEKMIFPIKLSWNMVSLVLSAQIK